MVYVIFADNRIRWLSYQHAYLILIEIDSMIFLLSQIQCVFHFDHHSLPSNIFWVTFMKYPTLFDYILLTTELSMLLMLKDRF